MPWTKHKLLVVVATILDSYGRRHSNSDTVCAACSTTGISLISPPPLPLTAPPTRLLLPALRGALAGEEVHEGGEEVFVARAHDLRAAPPESVPSPPPPRTKWTRCVPHPVLIGHAARRELMMMMMMMMMVMMMVVVLCRRFLCLESHDAFARAVASSQDRVSFLKGSRTREISSVSGRPSSARTCCAREVREGSAGGDVL